MNADLIVSFSWPHVIIFQFVEMKKEMGKTGGGPGDEEVMKHLSEAEKLSLAYTGWARQVEVRVMKR